MKLPIYLDYAATTPVDERVAKEMMQCLTMDGNFGNPASRSHRFGWQAEEVVDQARTDIADLINADPREIVSHRVQQNQITLLLKVRLSFTRKKVSMLLPLKLNTKQLSTHVVSLSVKGLK